MNAVEKLARCDLGHEVYHSDGCGHVQVETVAAHGFETPAVLLTQIEQNDLWPEFYDLVKTKPDSWLLRLVTFFPSDQAYSTRCFVRLLNLLSDRQTVILLVQDAPHWYWDRHNVELMAQVEHVVNRLIAETETGSMDGDIELSLLTDVIKRLERLKRAPG